MADTPGRLLSSLSNAEGRPSKSSGYGVFFHLFDWNRRLSGKHHKSLPPPERKSNGNGNAPKEVDKLSMAKLLLIADENRGYVSECPSEVGSERSSESGSGKRPGVVARLMGLESLPERAESTVVQQQQLRKQQMQQRYQELQLIEDMLKAEVGERKPHHMPSPSPRQGPSFEKMPKNTKPEHHMEKVVPVSPKKSSGFPFSSILSPSKSNNKSIPTQRSSGSMRRKALLMGAASKILEPASTPRTKLLLEDKAGESTGRSSGTRDKKSGTGNGRNGVKECEKRQECRSNRGSFLKEKNDNSSTKDARTLKVTKVQPRVEPCVSGEGVELDDETQSLECESQASSSKENHSVPECSAKVLRRSGSVKEEQPPTPPSRGSLFRSKSVKEEQVGDNRSNGNGNGNGKEVRLKREPKRPRPAASATEHKTEHVRRKPPLDQGRRPAGHHDVQPKDAKSKSTRPSGGVPDREQQPKGSGIGRLFGTRKQSSKPSKVQPGKTVEQPRCPEEVLPSTDEATTTKNSSRSQGTSLMKSLLRRRPATSKSSQPASASTSTSGSTKPVSESAAETSRRKYERQIRSAGSSPARTFNEGNHGKEGHLLDGVEQSYASDPEVLKEGSQRVHVPAASASASASPEKLKRHQQYHLDMSMEEIFKNYFMRKGGESPLRKESMSSEFMELVLEDGGDDPTVVDMDVSPGDNATDTSRYHGIEELPSKVLFNEEEDKQEMTTPCSPNKKRNLSDGGGVFAFSLDTSDSAKENTAACVAEDGGQPSPVSVLDFGALQSPFPSETTTTSSDDNDEDEKQTLLSDADSAPPQGRQASSCEQALLDILQSYETRLSDGSELNEDAGSEEIDIYVREVLVGSGLASDDFSEGIPSRDEIAERLERQKQAHGVESEMQLCSAPGSHKLMYGCIEDALEMVLDPLRDHNQLTCSLQRMRERPCGEQLGGMVTAYILGWRDMTPEAVDSLVAWDMCTSSKQWSAFADEVTEVGLHVETLIFSSLLEELVVDLLHR